MYDSKMRKSSCHDRTIQSTLVESIESILFDIFILIGMEDMLKEIK